VCQNDQPVLIAVDRAGLVGEDGTSHQGMFTLPAQLQLPHLVVASPKDEQELRSLLRTAMVQDHPFALHYPRDAGFGLEPVEPAIIPIGRGEVLREGRDVLFVGFGPIVARAVEAADALEADGHRVRMGVHIGEVETRGADVAGIGVHLAARVMAAAGPGEILTTAAVPLATLGGGFRFVSQGRVALKGFDDPFELFRLAGDEA